jgi:FdhD protein
MEIRLGGQALTTTMRTPGDDFDLALGFLLAEGIIAGSDDVAGVRYCEGTHSGEGESNSYNIVSVDLTADAAAAAAALVGPRRNFTMTSACGVCGTESIDALARTSPYRLADDACVVDKDILTGLPDRLREHQQAFETTGGLHAAGLFAADGRLVCVREDVGRHNAVDKVVGSAVKRGALPLSGHVLMVSGRLSFELVQKAAMAGIPVLAAVSAPSSLAVNLATEVGMTLVGFLRGETFNIYAGEHRISGETGR